MHLAGGAFKAAAERPGHASVGLLHDTYTLMLQELDVDAAARAQTTHPHLVGPAMLDFLIRPDQPQGR